MLFETHTLTAPLDKYIESIFHFKDFIPDHSVERVVPTGHLFIIFELDGMVRNTFDNETLQPNATFTKVWISGMHKNYISISAHQKSEMFVIQFKAFGAHPFLHLPIEELNEKVLPAENVLGEEVLTVRQQILEQKTSNGKFAIAQKWLEGKFYSDKTPPNEFLKTVQTLKEEPASKYNSSVNGYANTQKHLIDQFKKYIGLTPKYYQRILRFNDILQKIQKKESISWPQIAYSCGYSDQSHFIKEFNHFSGFNPQEFIQQEHHNGETNFFPLDREG